MALKLHLRSILMLQRGSNVDPAPSRGKFDSRTRFTAASKITVAFLSATLALSPIRYSHGAAHTMKAQGCQMTFEPLAPLLVLLADAPPPRRHKIS
jgi:hypothetical protein